MKDLEDARQKRIYNIIAIVKLVSLLFCYIIVYNRFSAGNSNLVLNLGFPNIFTGQLLICSIVLVYVLWLFFSVKIFRSRYVRQAQIAENLVFIVLFSTLNILCKSSVSEYKFMFLFIIITSTLQLGLKHGMITAVLSAISVLVIDLVYYTVPHMVNYQFQNDLIVAAVYVLTAWPLGHYVKIDNESIMKKDMELEDLSSKMNIQHVQYRNIENMILKNKDCYNLLIENSRDAIVVHRGGKIIFANESAAKIMGMPKNSDFFNKTINDIVPAVERKFLKEKYDEIYREKLVRATFEQEILDSRDNVIPIQNISTYFSYEGKPAILSIIHDLTSEKQVKKLEKDVMKNKKLLDESRELNKLITEFLSNVSHELKTPLNVIFSAIQVLDLQGNIDSENNIKKQKQYLKTMKQNCYRLMRLISNLLDITKLDSGFAKLNLHNINVVSFIEDITQSIVPYLDNKNIELTFDTDSEDKIMAVDCDKIERVLLNLLSNSIKFTDSGGKIFVNVEDEGQQVNIRVRDTGIGIPEDKKKLIFERFGQVNKSLRRECEGSGIGLYLVKSFVELHGGKINVKSTVGCGSEFTINLPVKIIEDEYDERALDCEKDMDKVNMEFSDIYF